MAAARTPSQQAARAPAHERLRGPRPGREGGERLGGSRVGAEPRRVWAWPVCAGRGLYAYGRGFVEFGVGLRGLSLGSAPFV